MFGPRIRMKSLSQTCRSLSTLLHSGVEIKKAFAVAADKTTDPRCRRAMQNIGEGISRGDDVSTAMRQQEDAFPDLVIDMVHVAEQTGMLPEILAHLADHYENSLRLRITFLTSLVWPAFQLLSAIFVIALTILVIGWIRVSRGGDDFDILGLGLTGAKGATTWLFCTLGPLAGLLVGYLILAKTFSGKRFLDSMLMQIPVVGGCMRSFAIARFSWAFYLTQQTGMPIGRSLDASLRATANGAFIAASPQICCLVRSGEHLTDALDAVGLFPNDFIQMVDVGETSGTVPEALHRLSPQFEEQARRSLVALTAALGWGVWALVAVFIIFLVFSIFLQYIGMISELSQGI